MIQAAQHTHALYVANQVMQFLVGIGRFWGLGAEFFLTGFRAAFWDLRLVRLWNGSTGQNLPSSSVKSESVRCSSSTALEEAISRRFYKPKDEKNLISKQSHGNRKPVVPIFNSSR